MEERELTSTLGASRIYQETVRTGFGPAEVSVYKYGMVGYSSTYAINVRFWMGETELATETVSIDVDDVVRAGMENLRKANEEARKYEPISLSDRQS